MPIIRSGYRSDEDKSELQAFYNSASWKRARAAVLARAGGRCEFCQGAPDRGRPLDVVHLTRSTLELLRSGGNPCNLSQLAAGHRRCHSGYSSGPAHKVAGSTVRGCVTATSALFRFAVHRGIIDRNPCRDLERGDRPSGKRTSEPRYLDAGQIARLLDELGDEFRPIAACCAYGAMRIGEALALTWADVDFSSGMIAVPGTKTAASAQPVPMIETLAVELRAHRATQTALSFARVKPAALVFQTATGMPQHRKNTLRAVWRAGDAAGLNPKGAERVGLHDLRHSCAGLLLSARVPMPKVAAILRHSNPRITADTYAGVVETERAKLIVDLASAFV